MLRHKKRGKLDQAQNITQVNFAKYYSTLETNWKKGKVSEIDTLTKVKLSVFITTVPWKRILKLGVCKALPLTVTPCQWILKLDGATLRRDRLLSLPAIDSWSFWLWAPSYAPWLIPATFRNCGNIFKFSSKREWIPKLHCIYTNTRTYGVRQVLRLNRLGIMCTRTNLKEEEYKIITFCI